MARSRVNGAEQIVQQTRASLGLPINHENPLDAPADLEQNYSLVRQALGQMIQSVAPLGFFPTTWDVTPQQAIEEFYKQDPKGDLNRIYARLIAHSPSIQQAETKLELLMVAGLGFLIFWELRTASPIIDFRVLRDRNLAVGCVILFCAFGVLYAASISLPAMLQTLFGYDAEQAGLVLSPAGISSMCALVIAGVLLARGMDARWLVAAGLLLMATSNYWMAHMNLEISPRQVIAPRMVLTAGLGLIIAPISVAAYMYIPPHLRGAAIGLASLLRNEGGSVGTSMAQTIQIRREQFHRAGR